MTRCQSWKVLFSKIKDCSCGTSIIQTPVMIAHAQQTAISPVAVYDGLFKRCVWTHVTHTHTSKRMCKTNNVIIICLGYLFATPRCGPAERTASPRYLVPLLESWVQHVHPLLMINTYIKSNLLCLCLSKHTYTHSHRTCCQIRACRSPGLKHKRAWVQESSLLCFPVLKPGLDYAAPFPRRQGDGLTSPTEYLTPDPNKQEVRGEANSSSVLSEAL